MGVAEVKLIDIVGDYLSDYDYAGHERPHLHVTVSIGPEDSNGSNYFEAFFYRDPDLDPDAFEIRLRRIIALGEFSEAAITRAITHVMGLIQRETWDECVEELRKYFFWEYEGMPLPAAQAKMPTATLHHLSFGIALLGPSIAFYDAALAPLGLVRVWSAADAVGYGPPGGGDLLALKLQRGPVTPPGPGFHLAFGAATREAVDGFHAAALAAGGKDNGAPGLRPHYGPDYYAAFVIDPDGHRLEAVCKSRIQHAPPEA